METSRRILSLVASLMVLSGSALSATLKKAELDTPGHHFGSRHFAELRRLPHGIGESLPVAWRSISAYRQGAALAGDDLTNIGRLLGLYNRLRNEFVVIATLGEMVALPTVRDDKIPPDKSPAIIAFGQLAGSLAERFGLQYRNVDNHIFEVTLPGEGKEEFGILTHCDVVPAVADEWVLENGDRLDPFKMTKVGGYLYGRGTIDDKGSIAAVLYAMKAVKESGVKLATDNSPDDRNLGGDDRRRHGILPSHDDAAGLQYRTGQQVSGRRGRKGRRRPARAVSQPAGACSATAVIALSGAASASTIPETATATLKGGNLDSAARKLDAARAAFIRKYEGQGGKFSIEVKKIADAVQVKVTGVSAHGSRPEEGVNSLPRLTLFLRESGVKLADNHVLAAVDYVNDIYGSDYLGGRLGVGYRDEFMGPLTMSPTFTQEKDGRLEVAVNVRMPRGNTPDALRASVTEKINRWAVKRHQAVTIEFKQDNWMVQDPGGAWVETLLNIFGDTTGLPAQPVSTAGSTTAKLMPNAINFGPAMPGKKYTAHNAREYKETADLAADLQMFTEMLVRIGNLGAMR